MDQITPTSITNHYSIIQLAPTDQLIELELSPLSESCNSQWIWKRGCLPAFPHPPPPPYPSLCWGRRKEVASPVSKAKEPGTRSFGEFIWQRAPDGQNWQLSCGPCELHDLMPFRARDRTEGLYSHCTCPLSNRIDFCSQKLSISVTISLGLLPRLSPGKKGLASCVYVMELFSLFSSVFIFVRDFRDQKPTHSLWFWICKKWHNIVFHYFFKRWCVMSLLLSTDS